MAFRIGEACGTNTESFICFADKHGVPVWFGKKRDAAQWILSFLTEFARGMDEAHCGFTAVDNRDTLE